MRTRPWTRPIAAVGVVGLTITMTVAVTFASSGAASADTPTGPGPIMQRSAQGVTADALPTVQIDGVVWSQAVVGNTVYAGGSFANARPAGAAPGTNLTPRANLLSYTLSTGVLNNSFAPSLNAQVNVVTASPDGSRIYVGGSFTTADGQARYRIAAYSTATGQLISSFAPNVDAVVDTIVATNTTVYVGGGFSRANGVARSRLAAFSATNGALLAWAPTADNTVNSMVMVPDQSRLIVGGSFLNLNGSFASGLGALDATTGALLPWAVTSLVQDGGSGATVADLTTDGTYVYGVAWAYFSPTATLEGAFSADPDTGALNWIENCHGDVYQVYAVNGAAYTVGHNHWCVSVGGFPQTQPWTYHRSMAFTSQATGTLGHDVGNPDSETTDFYGEPAPSIIDWFPDLDVGTYTGQNQGPWTVRGNSQYIVEGGEFLHVNGVAQQGLVRFANPSLATNKQGPRLGGSSWVPTVVSLSAGTARVTFPANWDRDDKTLSYNVTRNGTSVWTTTADSEFWNTPTLGFVDTGLTPGATYSYRVSATDPSGNKAVSNTVSFTVPTTAPTQTAYDQRVMGDGASTYWPMSESSGSTFYDNVGFNDATAQGGITRGVAGPVSPESATTFDGQSDGSAATQNAVPGPNTFTLSAWVQTTSHSGGKIIGFGDQQTGQSSNYDRHIYLDNAGHVIFGVYNGTTSTIQSSQTVNDGQWHQLVASLGSSGMTLYVDGLLVAHRSDVTTGQAFSGYWRIGGDNLNAWPSQPSSNYLAGNIGDVAIFPTELTKQVVQGEYTASGRTLNIPPPPTDQYGKTVYNDNPDLYWRLDDASGPTAADASGNSAPGVYSGGESFRVASPVTGPNGTAVTFNGSNGTVASQKAYTNPTVYSEEAWFNTTTTNGGKIIGFGNTQSGQSSNYDRHVFMNGNGTLTFGTWTGNENEAITSTAYNDGKWHQVVATQGPDGMKLYVDGQLAASNPQTQAQSYTGYWRVGGDTAWDGVQPWFAGTIDEVAVYSYELTAAQVLNHYSASAIAPATPPTATFTSSATSLTASFDGTGSYAADGNPVTYSWNFGDGSAAGTGATPTHTYSAPGTYSVTLTVTDDKGGTGTVTHSVTVTAPPPTAAFTATTGVLSASFDGTSSTTWDGVAPTYSWNFGDGSAAGTGATPTHAYAAAGTYTVTLTVTDDQGQTGTASQQVTVAGHAAPTAAFTVSNTDLVANFDASGSSAADGATITSYAWNFGDGSAAGSGVSPAHTYATGGTYTVTLTVTDSTGASSSASHSVTVAPHPAPTAAFTAALSGLTATFNASSSSASDGATITSYAWDFGDGSGTGTGVSPSYTYLASGTYTVVLTVTDSDGATGTVSHQVTVSNGPQVYASDSFARTATGTWGTADVGGAWTVSPASKFSTDGSSGDIALTSPAAGATALLNSVSETDVNMLAATSTAQAATGTGTYITLIARHVGNSDYRLKERLLAGGGVHLALAKVVNGTSTTLREVSISGITYNPGDVYNVRFVVTGNSPTTLSGTIWKQGTTEPTTPQITLTDSEPTLQTAGSVGVWAYISGTSTAPVTVSLTNFLVVKPS